MQQQNKQIGLTFCASEDTIKSKWKSNLQNKRTCLQITNLLRVESPEYIRSPYNSIIKRQSNLKMGKGLRSTNGQAHKKTPLVIRKMHIKTRMRCRFAPTRVACVGEIVLVKMWNNWNPHTHTETHCWWECKLSSHFGKQFGTPQNVKRVTWWPIPFLGACPRELRTYLQTTSWTQMFMAALFIIIPKWKQPKCSSSDEWINKMWYIHTMEYYSAQKEIL